MGLAAWNKHTNKINKIYIYIYIYIYLFDFLDIDLVLIDTKISFYYTHYQRYLSYWMRCNVWPQIWRSKVQVTTLLYICWIPRHWFSTYRHHTQVCVIYILPEISCWMHYVVFDLEFQDERSRSQPRAIFWIPWHLFSNYGYHWNTSFYDIYYQRYHIECVTSCSTLNFKDICEGYPWVAYR